MHFSCVRKGRGCLATEAREKRNSTIGLTRSILRSELLHLHLVALRKSTFIWNCDSEVLMGYVIPINSVTVITHLAFWNRPFPYILCKCCFNPCQNKLDCYLMSLYAEQRMFRKPSDHPNWRPYSKGHEGYFEDAMAKETRARRYIGRGRQKCTRLRTGSGSDLLGRISSPIPSVSTISAQDVPNDAFPL